MDKTSSEDFYDSWTANSCSTKSGDSTIEPTEQTKGGSSLSEIMAKNEKPENVETTTTTPDKDGKDEKC